MTHYRAIIYFTIKMKINLHPVFRVEVDVLFQDFSLIISIHVSARRKISPHYLPYFTFSVCVFSVRCISFQVLPLILIWF